MPRRNASDLQVRLAAQIVSYVKQRQLPAGHHVTEMDLAREFSVSRSPVVGALSYLARRGIVESRRNRGYYLLHAGSAIDAGTLNFPSTADRRLYERIMRDRVTAKLGDVVSEAELRRRYKVSLGLVRRALHLMTKDGIVHRTQGYGWVFGPSVDSESSHGECYELRLIVEPAAILSVRFKRDVETFAGLRVTHESVLLRGVSAITPSELFDMNSSFHETIARCSGNRYILQTVQHLNRIRRPLDQTGLADPKRMTASCKEHLAILDALEQGDQDWAAKLMYRHLDVASKLKLAYAHNGVEDKVDSAPSPMQNATRRSDRVGKKPKELR